MVRTIRASVGICISNFLFLLQTDVDAIFPAAALKHHNQGLYHVQRQTARNMALILSLECILRLF